VRYCRNVGVTHVTSLNVDCRWLCVRENVYAFVVNSIVEKMSYYTIFQVLCLVLRRVCTKLCNCCNVNLLTCYYWLLLQRVESVFRMFVIIRMSLLQSSKCLFNLRPLIFTARCCGYATVGRPSVCPSVCDIHVPQRDHIGCNSSKIISRPNTSRYLLTSIHPSIYLSNENTCKHDWNNVVNWSTRHTRLTRSTYSSFNKKKLKHYT